MFKRKLSGKFPEDAIVKIKAPVQFPITGRKSPPGPPRRITISHQKTMLNPSINLTSKANHLPTMIHPPTPPPLILNFPLCPSEPVGLGYLWGASEKSLPLTANGQRTVISLRQASSPAPEGKRRSPKVSQTDRRLFATQVQSKLNIKKRNPFAQTTNKQNTKNPIQKEKAPRRMREPLHLPSPKPN